MNKGSFLPALSLPVEDSSRLRSADFDGDGRADLFAGADPGAANVLFFSSTGEVERSVSLPAASSSTIADVTGDPEHLPEVIVGGSSVSAFQSSKSRRFSPLISALARVPESALLLSADVDCDGLRDFLLLNGNELSRVAPSGALTSLGKLSISSAKLLDPDSTLTVEHFRAVGRFENASAAACDMLALPGSVAGTVDIYGPSSAASATVERLSTITYPADGPPSRWLFADVNGDNYDDLLITGIFDVDIVANYVSYGVGDGTFHSDPLSLPAPFSPGADGKASRLDREGDILAASSQPGEPAQFFSLDDSPDGTHYYSAATLVDLAGDRAREVAELEVVAVGSGRRVDVLRGISTGHLSALSLPASGIPSIQGVADFDGDRRLDVLLSEAPGQGDINKIASVLFSQVANPSDPVGLAEFTSIGQMVPGYLQDEAGITDGNADIGVLYAGQDSLEKLGFLAGGSDRLLRSELPTEPAGDGYYVLDRVPVLGHFRDEEVRDLVVVEDLEPYVFNAARKTRLALFSIGSDGTSHVASVPLDSPIDLYGGLAAVGAIDADDDGRDELYAASSESLIALRQEDDTFPAAVVLAEPSLGGLRVQDANGDGKPDLAVTRDDQLWLLIAGSPSQPQKWHHFSAKAVGCSESTLNYAFIQADEDPELELALGCPYSFLATDAEPVSDAPTPDSTFPDTNLKICDVDLASDTLSVAYVVPAQNTGEFVVGDFNGDGVQDIAGQFGTQSLLLGEPR